MVFKLVGAAAVLACGAFYSYSERRLASRELEETEGALGVFERVRSEIADYGTPLLEILSGCGISGGVDGYLGTLSPELAELLCGARALGLGYRNEELRLCERLISLLKERQKALEQRAREVSALSRVKGYGLSAAIIILLM